MTGRNRIIIYGPKEDGSYVVEFRTADGDVLAISIPRNETAVIKHFQERMPYGLSCRTTPVRYRGPLGASARLSAGECPPRRARMRALRTEWSSRRIAIRDRYCGCRALLKSGAKSPAPRPHRRQATQRVFLQRF
jgi:hypothetical protein